MTAILALRNKVRRGAVKPLRGTDRSRYRQLGAVTDERRDQRVPRHPLGQRLRRPAGGRRRKSSRCATLTYVLAFHGRGRGIQRRPGDHRQRLPERLPRPGQAARRRSTVLLQRPADLLRRALDVLGARSPAASDQLVAIEERRPAKRPDLEAARRFPFLWRSFPPMATRPRACRTKSRNGRQADHSWSARVGLHRGPAAFAALLTTSPLPPSPSPPRAAARSANPSAPASPTASSSTGCWCVDRRPSTPATTTACRRSKPPTSTSSSSAPPTSSERGGSRTLPVAKRSRSACRDRCRPSRSGGST